MKKDRTVLFLIVGVFGFSVVLGVVLKSLMNQSSQDKWSFEDWVQKSDVSLTYFENNDKSTGRVINGGNWWEFKSYRIDDRESNCMEEIKQLGVLNRNESVRRFPNCSIGTLDYLIGEYKKYNPGGSIPYGISGELTISEGGKETRGTSQINSEQISKKPSVQSQSSSPQETSTTQSESTELEDMSVEKICFEIWKYNSSGGPSPSAFFNIIRLNVSEEKLYQIYKTCPGDIP